VTTAKTTPRARYAQRAGADAVMVLPVSYWKLSEREIFKYFLSIGDAIGIPITRYNNPATSGVDMSPELLMRVFETIDNVSMVKESTGDLFRMQRSDELTGGRLRFYNASNPLVLNALQAGATGSCTVGAVSATAALHRLVWSGTRERNINSASHLRRDQAAAGVQRSGWPGHHGEGWPTALGRPRGGSASAIATA
jgi:dihydrodipicolinate synthase/N-acetylneuraminate lyase